MNDVGIFQEDDDDEHLDTSESVIQELDSAFEVSPTVARGQKRKIESNPLNKDKADAPKKIVLNRNPSVSSDTNQNGSENNPSENKTDDTIDKKIVKLSELTVKEVFIGCCLYVQML